MTARLDAISWDEYFMLTAGLAAQRSKDPCTQVGAVIVNKYNRIVSTGYNGMPNGLDECPWGKDSENFIETKHAYVIHAEANAICNWYHRVTNAGYKIYVTLFPCCNCTKLIIQSGIKEVVYAQKPKNWKDIYDASEILLESSGVIVRQYSGQKDFTVRV